MVQTDTKKSMAAVVAAMTARGKRVHRHCDAEYQALRDPIGIATAVDIAQRLVKGGCVTDDVAATLSTMLEFPEHDAKTVRVLQHVQPMLDMDGVLRSLRRDYVFEMPQTSLRDEGAQRRWAHTLVYRIRHTTPAWASGHDDNK